MNVVDLKQALRLRYSGTEEIGAAYLAANRGFIWRRVMSVAMADPL